MPADLTTLGSTAIMAAVNGATWFFVMRYLTRLVERVENHKTNGKTSGEAKKEVKPVPSERRRRKKRGFSIFGVRISLDSGR
jgi:hypothetical protein